MSLFGKCHYVFLFLMLVLLSCSSDGTESMPDDLGEEPIPNEITPISVMYVEVNDQNIVNVGAYTRENGKPFFDIALIFAANINYDAEKDEAVLFLNSNVVDVLEDRELAIKPLQDKGIKVLLSVLGNRQRFGFANLPDRERAAIFAQQIANVIEENNLDGVDLDDEFVNYGEPGVPSPNESSFIMLLEELEKALPDDKIISFYNIGESSRFTAFEGVTAGTILDYSWQPFYGVYNGANTPAGLTQENYSASAINITTNNVSLAVDFARRTKQDRFGAYMMYNLTNTDYESYLNAVSEELYGESVTRTEDLKVKGEY